MAELRWAGDVRRNDPNAFIVPFVTDPAARAALRDLGYESYDSYLRSPKWHSIRERTMATTWYKCECCGRWAEEVHHRDYRPRVLAGEDLGPLVALCRPCHRYVEYDDKGRKREVYQDKERVLAELIAGRGSLVPGRDQGWFALEKIAPLNVAEINDAIRSGWPELQCAEYLRERRREYQQEYRRRKRSQALKEYEKRCANMSPYELGRGDAAAYRSAVETYNARPPNGCPFFKGTSEEAEYDRGWNDVMRCR